jgi:AcrR family transcriptional regulator
MNKKIADAHTDDSNNKKSLTNRQIGAQITKERIYKSALKLIDEKGYANVSIQDITDAAEVAKGSFYTHFRSKEHILRCTYDEADQFHLEAYLSLPDTDFLSMLHTFIHESYKKSETRGKEMLKAISDNQFSDDLKDVYKDKSRNLYKCLERIFEKGRVSNMIDASVSNEEYAKIVITVLVGVETMWCLSEDNAKLSETAASTIKTLALGMMAQNT